MQHLTIVSANPAQALFGPTNLEAQSWEENSISVFPNPANDQLKISLSENGILDNNLCIYNSTGMLVLEQTLKTGPNEIIIQTSDLPDGLYFIELNKAVRKRVLIQH